MRLTQPDYLRQFREKAADTINMFSKNYQQFCYNQWNIRMEQCRDSGKIYERPLCSNCKRKAINNIVVQIRLFFSNHTSYSYKKTKKKQKIGLLKAQSQVRHCIFLRSPFEIPQLITLKEVHPDRTQDTMEGALEYCRHPGERIRGNNAN